MKKILSGYGINGSDDDSVIVIARVYKTPAIKDLFAVSRISGRAYLFRNVERTFVFIGFLLRLLSCPQSTALRSYRSGNALEFDDVHADFCTAYVCHTGVNSPRAGNYRILTDEVIAGTTFAS